MVRSVAQKGVEQVAMGAVQLHAVESRLDGAGAGIAEVLDNAGDLVELQRAGRRNVDKALAGDEGLRVRGDGGGADGRLAILLEAGVGDTARMPELDHDCPALGVNGVGDLFPARTCRRYSSRACRHSLAPAPKSAWLRR